MAKLTVHVTPRAAADSISGFDTTGALRVRVTAPPAEGAANAAVTKLLSRQLNIPARDVQLILGASARTKVFELPLEEAEIRRRLQSL